MDSENESGLDDHIANKLKIKDKRFLRLAKTLSTSRSWRRNERDADKVNRSLDTYKKKVQKFKSNRDLQVIGGVDSDPINSSKLGTNIILDYFEVSNQNRNEAIANYKKNIVKQSSRIAYDYHQKFNEKINLSYLFEAVAQFGEENVREIIFKKGIKPEQLLTEYSTNEIGGFKIVAPKTAKVSLEDSINFIFMHPDKLEQSGFKMVYSGLGVKIIDYVKRQTTQ